MKSGLVLEYVKVILHLFYVVLSFYFLAFHMLVVWFCGLNCPICCSGAYFLPQDQVFVAAVHHISNLLDQTLFLSHFLHFRVLGWCGSLVKHQRSRAVAARHRVDECAETKLHKKNEPKAL